MRFSKLFPVIPFLVLPLFTMAASFPDVPASYPHRDQIEKLVDRGVISGNPDGTFRPYDPVDRASTLKMLYKAAGLTVNADSKNCFPDVVKGSWYEGFVCDAYARGFVKGYDNGALFKPGRPVTRAEALKLAIVILGVPAKNDTSAMYSDVWPGDWYFEYVHTALGRGILPIPGQELPTFAANSLLERGQAAAYIWNALNAKVTTQEEQEEEELPAAQSSAAASAATTSVGNTMESARESQRKDEQSAVESDKRNSFDVTFPFTESKTFENKHSLSFNFSVSSDTLAEIAVQLASGSTGKVSCRLYRMEKSGFSTEYYLGIEDGQGCHLRVALSPGQHQLQLFPTVANQKVQVTATTGVGDGNDGFREAKPLQYGKIRVEVLDGNDLEDWYTFTVTHNTNVYSEESGQEHTVSLVSGTPVKCLIYPMADVDLFGFAGPVCNEKYIYPVGRYMVNIRHPLPRASRNTYSLEVR